MSKDELREIDLQSTKRIGQKRIQEPELKFKDELTKDKPGKFKDA